MTGLALASTGTKTVKTAHNKKLGKTIRRRLQGPHPLPPGSRDNAPSLLQEPDSCFSFWPPYRCSRSAKLTKGTGIKGKLGKLHRHGFFQVTLGGKPLYRYSGDHNKKGADERKWVPGSSAGLARPHRLILE